jgi:hypothetical protein
MYPPSPVSPPQLPIGSPPPRLMSPFVLAAHRSPSHSPGPEDRTGFDLTVSCDSLPRPSKKRRVSASPERASATAYDEKTATVTKERETCPPAVPGFGECDMDLESESDSDSSDSAEADATYSSKSKSQPSSRAASSSPPAEAEAETSSPLQQRPTPPPPVSPARVRLHLECVDIMYLPTNGKLVCRVCLCVPSLFLPLSSPTDPTFQTRYLGQHQDFLWTAPRAGHGVPPRCVVGHAPHALRGGAPRGVPGRRRARPGGRPGASAPAWARDGCTAVAPASTILSAAIFCYLIIRGGTLCSPHCIFYSAPEFCICIFGASFPPTLRSCSMLCFRNMAHAIHYYDFLFSCT